MARPLIVTQLHEILNAMAPRHRRDRRSRVSRIPVAESLECRGLMSITASGVISFRGVSLCFLFSTAPAGAWILEFSASLGGDRPARR